LCLSFKIAESSSWLTTTTSTYFYISPLWSSSSVSYDNDFDAFNFFYISIILEKSVTFSKSLTTLSKTGSSPSSIPSFLSNLVISGTFLEIYLIHSVILRALLFLLVPDFLVALASLITYYLSLIRVRLSSATFFFADSFFPSTASS